MTEARSGKGTLFLVPTPLDFGCQVEAIEGLDRLLPGDTLAVAASLTHWIGENAKSARAFLKRVAAVQPLVAPIQEHSITELPRQAHKKGDHAPDAHSDALARTWLQPALDGHDIGLLSEAGMPAVADPGSSVVRAAHALGITVRPLTGPVSLMLALAASGLNGQDFAFVGYVPQDSALRSKRLKALESTAVRSGQTQLLIETPYRNAALLNALLQDLQAQTRLAVCVGLGLRDQCSRSATVGEWRSRSLSDGLPLNLPAVFLLGR